MIIKNDGTFYKTRVGHKVRIYAIGKRIHGAYFDPESDWIICWWEIDGRRDSLRGKFLTDIISEWSEPEAPKFKRKAFLMDNGWVTFVPENIAPNPQWQRAEWLDEP